MKKTIAALLGLAILFAQSCVGAKVYRAEKKTRIAAETREKVLVEELLHRRKEAANLIQTVGDLNKNIGRQELEIKNLQTELTSRTQSMGESSSKLAAEKSSLEKQYTLAQEQLEYRNNLLQRVKSAQDKRKAILADLETALNRAFAPKKDQGIRVSTQGELMLLTLPDQALFEPSGLLISSNGQTLLSILGAFMAARPGLDADIVAYTDNVLPPREKSLRDTWDWSLQRATNVLRILTWEYNVNANQLTPVGRGEFYPVTSNETAEGRASNRRTVVVFRPKLPELPQID